MTTAARTATLCAALGLTFAAPPAPGHAELIVDWGGEHVTGNTNFSRSQTSATGLYNADASTDARRGLAFDTDTPVIAIGTTAGASVYGGTSAEFYGGMALTLYDTETAGSFSSARINQSGTSDRLQLVASNPAAPAAFHNVFLWKKADFLAGSTAPAVTFDNTSTISVTVPSNNGPLLGRYVVDDGGVLYISQDTFDGSTSGDKTLAPAGKNWAPYSPAALALDFDADAATFAPHTFTDVRAAGYYLEQDAIAAGSGNFTAVVTGFEVNAVIPEPASAALLTTGLALLARRRAR